MTFQRISFGEKRGYVALGQPGARQGIRGTLGDTVEDNRENYKVVVEVQQKELLWDIYIHVLLILLYKDKHKTNIKVSLLCKTIK